MTLTTFQQDLETINSLAVLPVTSADELLKKFQTIYSTFLEVEFGKYDKDALRSNAETTIRGLFTLRLTLRNKITSWAQRGLMRSDVVIALRDVFRILRYATDYIGELAISQDVLDGDETLLAAFTGDNNNTLINPDFDQQGVRFQSGDVLLVRGTFAASAAIARIGDADSQFSHVAIVHIDENGKEWLIEALIETGSIITPLEKSLAHGNSRAILFRHKNSELARDAAKYIYDHISGRTPPKGKTILYDFSMGLENYTLLFCSKLVRMAYDKASVGNVILPSFPTLFNFKNKDLIKRIGVTTEITFAPGDIEVEPDFDLVAEWRDYRYTPTLRFQDLALTKMFEWMELYNYKFKEDKTIRLISWFGRASANLSMSVKNAISSVIPVIPPNMTRKTIGTLVMLHKTAGGLVDVLEKEQAGRRSRDEHPLHPREVYIMLEDVREKSGGKIGYLKGRP